MSRDTTDCREHIQVTANSENILNGDSAKTPNTGGLKLYKDNVD